MNKNIIPVVFAADENYAMPLSVAITSMLANANDTTFYDIYILVPNEFSTRSKYLILSLQEEYGNCEIHFIAIDNKFDNAYIRIEHITTVTYYRLLIPSLLPHIDKCIYLDVDIIVNQDLLELFDTDLSNYYVAGVKSAGYHYPLEWAQRHSRNLSIPNTNQYINAGVLVMNTSKMRDSNLQEIFMELEKKKFHSQDQDIMNVACYNRIKLIDLKYNFMTTRFNGSLYNFSYDEVISKIFLLNEIEEAVKNPVIIHYANKVKPWNSLIAFNSELWWKYYELSPFNFNNSKLINNISLTPKVSVIIPVYDAQDYLANCLDSLINQTLREIEIICIDDGSTDNSFWILNKYASMDKRIKVLQQENSGAGIARNKGLEIAKGDFISFLDADDFFELNMLELAVNNIEDNDSDIVVVLSDKYIEQTKKFESANWTIRFSMLPKKQTFSYNELTHYENNEEYQEDDIAINELYINKYDNFQAISGFVWDKLFRREFLEKHNLNFSKTAIYNDLYFVYMYLLLANKISIINTVLVHQRKRSSKNSLTNRRSEYCDCVYVVLKEFKEGLIEKSLYQQYEKDFINYTLHLLLHTLDTVNGKAYCNVYNLIKEDWSNEFYLKKYDATYFFNKAEFGKYIYICNTELDEHLIERIELLSANNNTNTKRNNIKNNQSIKEFNKTKGQLRWARNELNKTRIERLEFKKQSNNIKNSFSYKIGRTITWLPRQFRKHNDENICINFNKNNTPIKNYEIFKNLPSNRYKDALKSWYLSKTDETLNLDKPQTFNEKIQWLKLYDSTPLKTQLADKYLVREWVANKIGKEYLIPLLGVWDNFDEIDFDKLPAKFALKTNHGCGWNYIVKDKSTFDKNDAKRKFDKWLKMNYAYYGLQLHYMNIKPKIIAEQYIQNADQLYDYKFMCSNGRVRLLWVDADRYDGHKRNFYDLNWNKSDIKVNDYPNFNYHLEEPLNFDKMIEFSQKLSEGFACVRVDFYEIDGLLYFGEMTFTSASGLCKWNPPEYDRILGDMIELPKKKHKIPEIK